MLFSVKHTVYLRDNLALNITFQILSAEQRPREFHTRVPNWTEIRDVARAARSASSRGQNGVQYIVCKRCPNILKRHWMILCPIWARGRITSQWNLPEGI